MYINRWKFCEIEEIDLEMIVYIGPSVNRQEIDAAEQQKSEDSEEQFRFR